MDRVDFHSSQSQRTQVSKDNCPFALLRIFWSVLHTRFTFIKEKGALKTVLERFRGTFHQTTTIF
jgi:hypothetical protein